MWKVRFHVPRTCSVSQLRSPATEPGMIGRSYRRLQKMRRACYERSLRSELSAWQPAISRRIPMLIFPLRSTYGIKRSSNCDRKTGAVHSCLESRRKRNVLDEIVSSARTSVLVLAALLAASLELSHGAETRTLIDRPDPDSRPNSSFGRYILCRHQ